MPEFLCPRCARALEPFGIMLLPGSTEPLPLVHCEHCVIETEMFGMKALVHPTYYVDEDGQLVSSTGTPVDPDDN